LESLNPDVVKPQNETATAQGDQINADTEAARRRQVETHDKTNKNLAYLVTVFFFLLVGGLMFMPKEVDQSFKDLVFVLLGVVGTGWANIIGFYFGSSAGSQQKTQALTASMLRTP
jgi:hypothetical protein